MSVIYKDLHAKIWLLTQEVLHGRWGISAFPGCRDVEPLLLTAGTHHPNVDDGVKRRQATSLFKPTCNLE